MRKIKSHKVGIYTMELFELENGQYMVKASNSTWENTWKFDTEEVAKVKFNIEVDQSRELEWRNV